MKNDPLREYRKLRQALIDERDRLRARLAEIEETLSAEGALPTVAKKTALRAPSRKGRPASTRGRKGLSLKQAVLQVLSEKPMTKQEILAAVQAAGYSFRSKNPMNSLGVVLYGRNPKFNNQDGIFSLGRGARGIDPEGAGGSSRTKAKTKAKAVAKKKRGAKARVARK